MASKPRLVIIGSGWAGFYVAENINLAAYSVTMISPRRTSAYTPLLASAAVGLFNFSLAEEAVRSKSRKDLRFLKAVVSDVDFNKRVCKCTPAFDDGLQVDDFQIEYDHLIIAPGCQPNTFGTPGVAEYGLFVKNVSDAMAVRKKLFDLLEKASLPSISEEQARSLLHIAIVGGGPTGIELTAELDDLCNHELKELYPDVVRYVSISIYDVAPNILSAYDSSLHEYATKRLKDRKIDVAVNTHIESVDESTMHIKEQGAVKYGMLIWATGNEQVPLVESLADRVRLPAKGLKRIITDSRLRVFKHEGTDEIYESVFAIGDAADMDGSSLPTTAEVAVQKARYLVENFNQASKGQDMLNRPFQYQQKRLVSYIGAHDGVIAGKGPDDQGWTGKSAWLSWRSGSLMWNRNWRSRLVIILTWILNAIFGVEVAKI